MPTDPTKPLSPEHKSLLATRANLQASIDAREKQQENHPSADFPRVTDIERGRLREVEARIAEIAASAPATEGDQKTLTQQPS